MALVAAAIVGLPVLSYGYWWYVHENIIKNKLARAEEEIKSFETGLSNSHYQHMDLLQGDMLELPLKFENISHFQLVCIKTSCSDYLYTYTSYAPGYVRSCRMQTLGLTNGYKEFIKKSKHTNMALRCFLICAAIESYLIAQHDKNEGALEIFRTCTDREEYWDNVFDLLPHNSDSYLDNAMAKLSDLRDYVKDDVGSYSNNCWLYTDFSHIFGTIYPKIQKVSGDYSI